MPRTSSTALITGASGGLGKEIALFLSKSGRKIIAQYKSSERKAEQLKVQCEALGGQCELWQSDLAKSSEIESLEKKIEATPSLNILINAASTYKKNSLLQLSEKELEEELRVNALSTLSLARAFSLGNKENGQIINFLDARAPRPISEYASYSLAKSLLFHITESLALELAPRITVNAISPGFIAADNNPNEAKAALRSCPLKKHGKADDILHAVEFLLASKFITGQTIYIDGGRHLLR